MYERPVIGFVTVEEVAGSTPKKNASHKTKQDPLGNTSSIADGWRSNYISGTVSIIAVNSAPITLVTR